MADVSLTNTTAALSGKAALLADGDATVTALHTFNRGSGSAPFAVNSGAAVVANLDADKVDGIEASGFVRTSAAATKDTGDLTFNDNIAATFGTGGDADIVYDGTDLLVKPAVVGTGDVVVQGGSLEFDDSEGVTLGTGKDATLQYDGTDVVLNTAAVGSGALSLTKGQIKFPGTQNASSDVNTLDDYEEGTWTPVIGGSGGTSGQTYSSQAGFYIKIGRLVLVHFAVTLTAKGTITTDVQIQGLPFTVSNDTAGTSVGAVSWQNLATNWVNIIMKADINATTATLSGATAAAGSNNTALATADINNNTVLRGTLMYRASA